VFPTEAGVGPDLHRQSWKRRRPAMAEGPLGALSGGEGRPGGEGSLPGLRGDGHSL